jgi:hypothetical protein
VTIEFYLVATPMNSNFRGYILSSNTFRQPTCENLRSRFLGRNRRRCSDNPRRTRTFLVLDHMVYSSLANKEFKKSKEKFKRGEDSLLELDSSSPLSIKFDSSILTSLKSSSIVPS